MQDKINNGKIKIVEASLGISDLVFDVKLSNGKMLKMYVSRDDDGPGKFVITLDGEEIGLEKLKELVDNVEEIDAVFAFVYEFAKFFEMEESIRDYLQELYLMHDFFHSGTA